MTRVTRRTAYRGLPVTVTLRDGTVHTGSLRGWGANEIQLTTDDGRYITAAPSTATVTTR